jgi:hypothetical protein
LFPPLRRPRQKCQPRQGQGEKHQKSSTSGHRAGQQSRNAILVRHGFPDATARTVAFPATDEGKDPVAPGGCPSTIGAPSRPHHPPISKIGAWQRAKAIQPLNCPCLVGLPTKISISASRHTASWIGQQVVDERIEPFALKG